MARYHSCSRLGHPPSEGGHRLAGSPDARARGRGRGRLVRLLHRGRGHRKPRVPRPGRGADRRPAPAAGPGPPPAATGPPAPQAPPSGVDFREETIYFLITTRFYDGDPANNFYCRDRIAFDPSGRPTDPHWRGDFKGLIEQLDYLKDLGFTAIWITPPIENRSGLDYHGYHGYDRSEERRVG